MSGQPSFKLTYKPFIVNFHTYISYTDEVANLGKIKFTDQQVPIKNCSFRVLRKKVGAAKPPSVVFVMTTKG